MKKGGPAEVLATNLRALMAHAPDLDSGPKLESRSKVAQKTISNVLNGRHDTQLSTIEKLAKAFGLETWQLITPIVDSELLPIIRAYNQSDETGKRLLGLAAQTALSQNRDAGGTSQHGRSDDDRKGADKSVSPLHARVPK